MKQIRNGAGKLVCCINDHAKSVEILHKGYKTTIRFKRDGTLKIINSKVA